jgi:hypothetical protein
VADGRSHVPPEPRDLSMVFQDYAACGYGSPNDGPGLTRSPPRSPACKPSPPADQPEQPYDQEGETPGPVEPRPPGATAGQPAMAGAGNHPPAEQLRPAPQWRERSRLGAYEGDEIGEIRRKRIVRIYIDGLSSRF